MMLRGVPPTPPAVSAFALSRMPAARASKRLASIIEDALSKRSFEVVASTCLASVAMWRGPPAVRRAAAALADRRPVEAIAEQVAWIHYELELLGSCLTYAQDGVSIQVSPAAVARARAETTIAPPLATFPELPTCIRTDGTRPTLLPNGMPVDAIYLEWVESMGGARILLMPPLGDGNAPRAEGAAFIVTGDDVREEGLEGALLRSIDRKVDELERGGMLSFHAPSLRAALAEQVPTVLVAMRLASWALRAAEHVPEEVDRLAPDAIARLDRKARGKAGWPDVIHL